MGASNHYRCRVERVENVVGMVAAYARFDGYVPRQEPPAFLAGGKVAHFERVEWTVQPDPATAAAALRKNEADRLEQPLIDLIPMVNKAPGVYTKVIEPGGWMMFMVLNHLNSSFDNLKVRQAILLAMDQQAFVASVVGEQRDLAKAKQMIAGSGYAGEPVVLMSSGDQPALKQMSEVARELFQTIGLKVDYQETDFGSVVTRRASRNPVNQGGRGTFITQMSPLTAANPGSMLSLCGNGRKGWFGWPTNERIEQ